MSRIKSAWEIALERTENIQVDKEKIKYNDTLKSAQALVSLFINDTDNEQSFEQTLEKLNALDGDKAKTEGILNAILQNFSLPTSETIDERSQKAKQFADYISNNNPQVTNLTGQLVAFLKQYPEHKKQLIEQLKAQFEPELREKEAKLRETYGDEVQLSVEQDKDFLQIANKNLEQLTMQYTQTLEGAKAQLKQLLG